MKTRTFLRPSILLALTLGFQLILTFLFLGGLLHTFRLQAKPISGTGLAHLVLFDLIAIGMTWMFEKIKTPILWTHIWFLSGMKMLILWALLSIGIYGLINVLISLPPLPVSSYFALGIQGSLRPLLPWGRGFTILHVALQVTVVWGILFLRKRRSKYLILLTSMTALAIYSSIYMSRIMFVAPLVALFIIVLRQWFYMRPIPVHFIVVIAIGLFSVLVLLQGFRTYEVLGISYTDNLVIWGISSLVEYFISTALYSVYVASWLGDPPMHPSDYFSTPELVNLGSLGQLMVQFGALYPLVLVVFLWIASRYWRMFDKGYPEGYLVYPFIAYTLLEMPRIFEFTTVTGIVRLGLLMALGWVCHNWSVDLTSARGKHA